jgi:hypothetical protein
LERHLDELGNWFAKYDVSVEELEELVEKALAQGVPRDPTTPARY